MDTELFVPVFRGPVIHFEGNFPYSVIKVMKLYLLNTSNLKLCPARGVVAQFTISNDGTVVHRVQRALRVKLSFK